MKPYRLMKVTEGSYNLRDSETDDAVGTLKGSGTRWDLKLFGKDFKLKSKAKALGVVRGVFAARDMVAKVFAQA